MEGVALFALVMAGLGLVAIRPQWGAPYFAALIYLRLSDTLRGEYGLPSLFMIVAPALVIIAFGRWLASGNPVGRGWKPALFLLTAYGSVCAASLIYALDTERTTEALMNYLDGVVIILVTTLYLRTPVDLDRVLWALLGGGILLASLTVFQQLTGSYDQTYAGLSRVELRNVYDSTAGYRSSGPVSANYYALVLVIAAPLAVDRLLHERSRAIRAAVAGGLACIVAAIVFTYSRGGVVALAAVAVPSALCWLPRRQVFRGLAAACVAGLGVAALAAPTDFGQRLAALGQVAGLVRGDVPSDSALRGRMSEMASAALMFADHPVIGVGYGNYEGYYHRYARTLALDGRREERQAHSLYLEVAAETGILGVAAFAILLAHSIAGVIRTRTALYDEGRVRHAQQVVAFAIALFGYLVGSLFLHLSYPRYLWLLLGIAIAVGALSEPVPRRFAQPVRVTP
jgi:putative inorganic carbon (hco3(-)) transporter